MGTFLFIIGVTIIVGGLIVLISAKTVDRTRVMLLKGTYTIDDFVAKHRQGVSVCMLLIGCFIVFTGFEWIVGAEIQKAKDRNKAFQIAQISHEMRMRKRMEDSYADLFSN